MKVLFVKIFLLVLLIFQISVNSQDKKLDIPNLLKVRIPLTDLPPGTTQQQSGDTSFFPSDPRNMWLYMYDREGGDPYPFIRANHVLLDTVLGGKLYYKYKLSGFLRYDRELQELYGWRGTSERLIADFKIEKPGTIFITDYDMLGGSGFFTYSVTHSVLPIFGVDRDVMIFDADSSGNSRYFEYTKGLGPNRLFDSYCCHGGYQSTSYIIKQAKIYDETGVTLFYNPSDKPTISFVPPQTIIDTSILRKAIKIGHPFSRRYGTPSWPGFYNHIDSAWITGYYSKRDIFIPAPQKRLVFKAYSDTSMIDYQLNDSLMRQGYKFNYRFIAIDKGIIPLSDTLPKTGYFSLQYSLVGIEDIPDIEIGYKLDQNYPNPFSSGGGSEGGSTVINYKLKQTGYVKGVVYDLLGSEVATLVDGEMPKGTHSIKFNGNGLSPGVYIFRITSNGHTKAIKMVLGK